MNKLALVVFGLLMLFIPAVLAEVKDIDDIPITITWKVAKDTNGTIYNITINVSSSEDVDHTFNRVITNTTSNDSDTIKIDIERDVACKDEDISNLTKTLLENSKGLVNTINNSFNFPKEYSDCLEGRAILSEKNKGLLFDSEKATNESKLYKGMYETESADKSEIKGRLDTCNTNLLDTNTERNNCSTELEKTKKKPMQYAIISILITLIAINIYNKNKEPKPPEMFQFREN